LLEGLLAAEPDQPQALLLLGIIRAEGPDIRSAETLLRRYLAMIPDDAAALHTLGRLARRRGDDEAAIELLERAAEKPGFASPLNDLGAALQRLGRHEAALAAFDRAIAIDPGFGTARCNRALVLSDLGQRAAAEAAFRDVLRIAPDSAAAWHNRAMACDWLGALGEAEAACRQAMAADPANLDAYILLAEVLERAHRPVEASSVRFDWARRQGTVVKPCTGAAPEGRLLLIGGAASCNVPTEFIIDRRRFDVVTLHLVPDDGAAPAALVEGLPPIDLVFNAIADADAGAPFLAPAAALIHSLGCPAINPPERIVPTRRDLVGGLLRDVPGLVVPEIERLTRAEAVALAQRGAGWTGPRLIRRVGSHGGTDLRRVDDPAALAPYLEAMPAEAYYLSEYRDYRSADGNFRKYRFIFVDREVFPYHLAIARDWMVHYWRAAMEEAAGLRQEEERFLADYTSVFPGELATTVRAVAHRLDLDYAGMDCALSGDGRVLLFEANANMLVHLHHGREDFAYKHAHVPGIAEAMSRLILRRATARTR
jgi:Tfp pilus assembly protein PilF/glutathione synthase/RimK-type ligase-like ATP-grasp enzyme